ncbi:MAG: hypothetical protein HKM89_12955 [Gemmatimonadales bacterium]|nr:hypothetical protein [Gemmatimonadales bacterium]
MYLRSALVWLLFGVVAFASGGLREAILVPRLGEHLAHQIGSVMVAAVIGLIAIWFIRRLGPTASEALTIGVLWVAMSVAFELGFFGLGMGEPWGRLVRDYNILGGRLWLLVLIVQLVTPYLVVRGAGRGATI